MAASLEVCVRVHLHIYKICISIDMYINEWTLLWWYVREYIYIFIRMCMSIDMYIYEWTLLWWYVWVYI